MEGTLSKWTNVMKGWQYRWFVLDENAGLFSYYTRKIYYIYTNQGCQSEGFLLGFGLIRKSEKLIQNCADSRKSEIRNLNLLYEKCTL